MSIKCGRIHENKLNCWNLLPYLVYIIILSSLRNEILVFAFIFFIDMKIQEEDSLTVHFTLNFASLDVHEQDYIRLHSIEQHRPAQSLSTHSAITDVSLIFHIVLHNLICRIEFILPLFSTLIIRVFPVHYNCTLLRFNLCITFV